MQFLVGLHGFSDWALLAVRLVLGCIFLAHGKMKWGTWRSPEPGGSPMPMKNIFRFLSIMEPLGGLAAIAGFLTQFAAMGFISVMLGAIWMKKMKWGRSFTGDGGWEFDLINLASAAAVVIMGAGAFSLDRIFFGL